MVDWIFLFLYGNEALEEDFFKLLFEEEEYMGKGSGYSLFCIDGLLLSRIDI